MDGNEYLFHADSRCVSGGRLEDDLMAPTLTWPVAWTQHWQSEVKMKNLCATSNVRLRSLPPFAHLFLPTVLFTPPSPASATRQPAKMHVPLILALTTLLAPTHASIASLTSAACKENSLQCGGGSPGGAVFVCRGGRWEVLIDCGPSESCTSDPVPTCHWRAGAGVKDPGAVSGFEIAAAEVAAAVKDKVRTPSY